MPGTLHVVAHVPAHPESVKELKTVLTALVEPSRKESGCIRYELWHNTETPTDFTFVEEWESEEALDAHLQTQHIADAFSQAGHLLGGEIDIRRYHQIE